MLLNFIGTKGEVEESNKYHKITASLFIVNASTRLLVDVGHGIDEAKLKALKPSHILITHAHPDHTDGLFNLRSKIPIYLTQKTAELLSKRNIKPIISSIFKEEDTFKIGLLRIKSYPVWHSILVPAVGFSINYKIWYSPDVLHISKKEQALKGLQLYIGDGSSPIRALVRKTNDKLIGHASMATQSLWASSAGIKKVIFTHFGKEVIEGDESQILNKLKWARKDLDITFAFDGMVYHSI